MVSKPSADHSRYVAIVFIALLAGNHAAAVASAPTLPMLVGIVALHTPMAYRPSFGYSPEEAMPWHSLFPARLSFCSCSGNGSLAGEIRTDTRNEVPGIFSDIMTTPEFQIDQYLPTGLESAIQGASPVCGMISVVSSHCQMMKTEGEVERLEELQCKVPLQFTNITDIIECHIKNKEMEELVSVSLGTVAWGCVAAQSFGVSAVVTLPVGFAALLANICFKVYQASKRCPSMDEVDKFIEDQREDRIPSDEGASGVVTRANITSIKQVETFTWCDRRLNWISL